jgi:hypothetical protein
MGDPPALPGRQSKFDISGGRPRLSIGETPEREPPKRSRGSKVTAVPPTYAASQVVGSEEERHRPEVCVWGKQPQFRWWASLGTQVFCIGHRAR